MDHHIFKTGCFGLRIHQMIDTQRADIPDLQRDHRGRHIGKIIVRNDKTAFHGMQQRNISADQIDKNQIIDQLDLFNFSFL